MVYPVSIFQINAIWISLYFFRFDSIVLYDNNQLQGNESVHQWLQRYTEAAVGVYFI